MNVCVRWHWWPLEEVNGSRNKGMPQCMYQVSDLASPGYVSHCFCHLWDSLL